MKIADINQPNFNQASLLSEIELQSIQSWVSNLGEREFQRAERTRKVIGLTYPIIGHGSLRVVFDLNNGYVLKIAKRKIGLDSITNEVNLHKNLPPHLRKHLCPVKEFGRGWIIMKKMNPISTINQDCRDKILEVKNVFLKSGIEPQDLKSAYLSLSREGDIIVIDYGNFTSR